MAAPNNGAVPMVVKQPLSAVHAQILTQPLHRDTIVLTLLEAMRLYPMLEVMQVCTAPLGAAPVTRLCTAGGGPGSTAECGVT